MSVNCISNKKSQQSYPGWLPLVSGRSRSLHPGRGSKGGAHGSAPTTHPHERSSQRTVPSDGRSGPGADDSCDPDCSALCPYSPTPAHPLTRQHLPLAHAGRVQGAVSNLAGFATAWSGESRSAGTGVQTPAFRAPEETPPPPPAPHRGHNPFRSSITTRKKRPFEGTGLCRCPNTFARIYC